MGMAKRPIQFSPAVIPATLTIETILIWRSVGQCRLGGHGAAPGNPIPSRVQRSRHRRRAVGLTGIARDLRAPLPGSPRRGAAS